LRNSSARFRRLYDPFGERSTKWALIQGNAPEGGISCERGANDEEPISVLNDTIAAANCQFGMQKVFFFFEKKKTPILSTYLRSLISWRMDSPKKTKSGFIYIPHDFCHRH
jgi:hypothetical protein